MAENQDNSSFGLTTADYVRMDGSDNEFEVIMTTGHTSIRMNTNAHFSETESETIDDRSFWDSLHTIFSHANTQHLKDTDTKITPREVGRDVQDRASSVTPTRQFEASSESKTLTSPKKRVKFTDLPLETVDSTHPIDHNQPILMCDDRTNYYVQSDLENLPMFTKSYSGTSRPLVEGTSPEPAEVPEGHQQPSPETSKVPDGQEPPLFEQPSMISGLRSTDTGEAFHSGDITDSLPSDLTYSDALKRYRGLVDYVEKIVTKRCLQTGPGNDKINEFSVKRLNRILNNAQQISSELRKQRSPEGSANTLQNCFSYATASKERTKDTKTWDPADFFGGDSIRPSVRTWNLDWGDNSSENRPAGAVLQNEIKSNIHMEREIDSEEQRPNYMKDTSVFCRHYRTSPEKSPISRLRKRCESLERQLARVERKRSPRGLRGTDDYPTDSLWAANRALRRRLEQLQEMQLQQDAKFRDARKDLDNLKSKRRLEEQYQMTESKGSISGSSWKDEPSSRDDIQYANRGPRDTWKSHTQTQPTSGQKRWVDRFENMNKRANNMRKVIRQLKTDYAKLSDSVIRMEEKAKLAADCVEALINRANLDKRCPISVTSASKCPLYKMDKCESYHRKAGYGKYR